MAEAVRLEVPPKWNVVPDLIMEADEGLMITETDTKWKRDELAGGCRKWWKADDIGPEKCEQSLKVSLRTQNPVGFYSKDWDESQQEEDKWQRISQMVLLGGCLEINPEEAGYISRSCTQHQGGK